MTLKDFLHSDRLSFFLGVGAIVATLSIGTCSTNGRIADSNMHIDGRLQDFSARISDFQAQIGVLSQGLQAQIGELRQDIRRVEDILIAGGGRAQSGGGGAPTVTPSPETDD